MQAMGGVKYIFLTHRDDVAEHAKWAKALGAERIMHIKETNEKQGTEWVLKHYDYSQLVSRLFRQSKTQSGFDIRSHRIYA